MFATCLDPTFSHAEKEGAYLPKVDSMSDSNCPVLNLGVKQLYGVEFKVARINTKIMEKHNITPPLVGATYSLMQAAEYANAKQKDRLSYFFVIIPGLRDFGRDTKGRASRTAEATRDFLYRYALLS